MPARFASAYRTGLTPAEIIAQRDIAQNIAMGMDPSKVTFPRQAYPEKTEASAPATPAAYPTPVGRIVGGGTVKVVKPAAPSLPPAAPAPPLTGTAVPAVPSAAPSVSISFRRLAPSPSPAFPSPLQAAVPVVDVGPQVPAGKDLEPEIRVVEKEKTPVWAWIALAGGLYLLATRK